MSHKLWEACDPLAYGCRYRVLVRGGLGYSPPEAGESSPVFEGRGFSSIPDRDWVYVGPGRQSEFEEHYGNWSIPASGPTVNWTLLACVRWSQEGAYVVERTLSDDYPVGMCVVPRGSPYWGEDVALRTRPGREQALRELTESLDSSELTELSTGLSRKDFAARDNTASILCDACNSLLVPTSKFDWCFEGECAGYRIAVCDICHQVLRELVAGEAATVPGDQ